MVDELTGGQMAEKHAAELIMQVASALPYMDHAALQQELRKAQATHPDPRSLSDGLDRIHKMVQQDV